MPQAHDSDEPLICRRSTSGGARSRPPLAVCSGPPMLGGAPRSARSPWGCDRRMEERAHPSAAAAAVCEPHARVDSARRTGACMIKNATPTHRPTRPRRAAHDYFAISRTRARGRAAAAAEGGEDACDDDGSVIENNRDAAEMRTRCRGPSEWRGSAGRGRGAGALGVGGARVLGERIVQARGCAPRSASGTVRGRAGRERECIARAGRREFRTEGRLGTERIRGIPLLYGRTDACARAGELAWARVGVRSARNFPGARGMGVERGEKEASSSEAIVTGFGRRLPPQCWRARWA